MKTVTMTKGEKNGKKRCDIIQGSRENFVEAAYGVFLIFSVWYFSLCRVGRPGLPPSVCSVAFPGFPTCSFQRTASRRGVVMVFLHPTIPQNICSRFATLTSTYFLILPILTHICNFLSAFVSRKIPIVKPLARLAIQQKHSVNKRTWLNPELSSLLLS